MSPIVLITEPPRSITLEEHRQLTSSTPASFDDIPPVLRHKEEGLTVTLDPPLEGFSAEDSKGTLYIIESVLAFVSDTGKGFQIDYPTITLHAIARAESGPSIYCQLDESPQNQHGQDEDTDDVTEMRELKLIPTDPSSLEPLFEGLSICAALHPDPQDKDDDMDDAFLDANEGRFETFTGDEGQELSEVGRVRTDFINNSRYAPY
ncbi:hypothetical protein M422DRAFT_26224 [Sphaerobolus stellatus SS14]|nr:hypothetical protein M422DRAFT_26224 [Sphaerobolus stellatus SS14]